MSEWRPVQPCGLRGWTLYHSCSSAFSRYPVHHSHLARLSRTESDGEALPPCLSCWGLFIIPTPFPRTLRGTGMTASRLIVVGARGKARNKNQSAPLIPVIPSSLIRGKQDLLKQSCGSRAASGLRKGGVMSDHPLWRR